MSGRPALRTNHPLLRLPAVAGWSFLAAGFAARLPQAMTPIGMLLLVAATTGSYAYAGLAIAAWSVGCAVGGPLLGSCADRYGHRVVGLVAAGGNCAALVGFVGTAYGDGPRLAVIAVAALVGATNPQAGSLARHRWAALLASDSRGGETVTAAMAYEGAADETSFVLGPVLAGTLAGIAGPAVPLLVAAAICLVGQLVFALHRTALTAAAPRGAGYVRPPLPWRAIVPLGTVLAAAGLVFGSTQTGLAAVLGEQGHGELTGLVYGALGVSSGAAGLASAVLPARFSLRRRVVLSAAALVVLAAPLPFASSPLSLAGGCALTGLAIAPMMIAGYALGERASPAGRGATVMTLLATAGTVGVALGAALAGQLADGVGAAAALAIPAAAALAALVGGLCAVSSERHRPVGHRPDHG